MRRFVSIFLFLFMCQLGWTQNDFMTVMPDTAGREMFSDFIGVKLWVGDYAMTNYGKDITFSYLANPYFRMEHDMNVTSVSNAPNLGIGVEEDLGPHLLINFLNISLGYGQDVWNWNIGCGIGYSQALNKKRTLRLRASLNFFYEDISFRLGTYYDTTNLGFQINGVSIGSSVKNVKFVNNTFSSNLCFDLMYRLPKYDFFINASYNYVLYSSQKINFYYTRIKPSDAMLDPSGNSVSGNILGLGNYIIQVGIIREFGL